MESVAEMFKDRRDKKDVQADVLRETYVSSRIVVAFA